MGAFVLGAAWGEAAGYAGNTIREGTDVLAGHDQATTWADVMLGNSAARFGSEIMNGEMAEHKTRHGVLPQSLHRRIYLKDVAGEFSRRFKNRAP